MSLSPWAEQVAEEQRLVLVPVEAALPIHQPQLKDDHSVHLGDSRVE